MWSVLVRVRACVRAVMVVVAALRMGLIAVAATKADPKTRVTICTWMWLNRCLAHSSIAFFSCAIGTGGCGGNAHAL